MIAVAFVVAIVVVVEIGILYRWSKTKPCLRSWAADRGVRILRMRPYLSFDLLSVPFAPMTMGWTWRYSRISVRDGSGQLQKGWARVNGDLLIIWDSGETERVAV